MSYENKSPEELAFALQELESRYQIATQEIQARDQQLKEAIEKSEFDKAAVDSLYNELKNTKVENDDFRSALDKQAEEINRWKESYQNANRRLIQGNSDYQKLLEENSQLNKALELKLDGMPSGLSAGQSRALEAHTRTLYDLLKAARCHIPESAMCGSIQRNIDEAMAKLTQQFPMFNPQTDYTPTPGTDDHNE